jgi:hypothetical protein
VGIVGVPTEGPAQLLREVRAAAHEGYDRVVFEFAAGVPGYHLEYIDSPVRACGSGDVVSSPGDAWLEVRLTPANAHDEQGKPTMAFAAQTLGLPNLLRVERTCDFEAMTTYVLSVRSPLAYRVLTLSDPPRIVVDVAHPAAR